MNKKNTLSQMKWEETQVKLSRGFKVPEMFSEKEIWRETQTKLKMFQVTSSCSGKKSGRAYT